MVFLRHVSIALSAAAAVLGSALFIAMNYLYRRRVWSYRTLPEQEREERGKRQVLVLGLDGAGKSSMLQGLAPGGGAPWGGAPGGGAKLGPTRGFNFMSLQGPACRLDFLEIGGREDLRRYWSEYLRKSHILVYVVDSSDKQRLPVAMSELQRLLKLEPQLPVVVLGNKQDKANAMSVGQLHEALSLDTVVQERRLFLLATQLESSSHRLGSSSHRLENSSHRLGSSSHSLGSSSPRLESSSHSLQAFHELLLQLV